MATREKQLAKDRTEVEVEARRPPAKEKWAFNPKPIEDMRKGLNLTPSALGGQLRPKMSGAQILDVVQKRRGLNVATLIRICNQFGLVPASLFTRVGGGNHGAGGEA